MLAVFILLTNLWFQKSTGSNRQYTINSNWLKSTRLHSTRLQATSWLQSTRDQFNINTSTQLTINMLANLTLFFLYWSTHTIFVAYTLLPSSFLRHCRVAIDFRRSRRICSMLLSCWVPTNWKEDGGRRIFPEPFSLLFLLRICSSRFRICFSYLWPRRFRISYLLLVPSTTFCW